MSRRNCSTSVAVAVFPLSSVTDMLWPLRSNQKILVIQPEHHASPVAAVEFILIGDVLARRHEVGESSAERQLVGEAAGAGRLEYACGEQRAAFDDRAGLE